MNRILLLIFILFYSNIVFSQKKVSLEFKQQILEKVIDKLEEDFEIKYSYVDSIIKEKTIYLNKKKYSLEEVNLEIETQTKLKIAKLSDRYYSIFKDTIEVNKMIQLDEILIESFLVKGIKKNKEKYILFPRKTEILPGVTDADVFLSLQQLPGVKSPNETATGLYVRGGTPDQNLLMLDGIRLFHPGHLFGMISGVNPTIVEKVSFYNKGTNSKYGERISSVIELETSNELQKKTKTIAGINGLNADLFFQTPLVKEKLDIQLSARKSFTELVQSYTFNQLANKVFQNTDFKLFNNSNKFQFSDYTLKLIYKPNEKSIFTISGISIDNNLNYNYKINQDSISNQEMKILNNGLSINWIKKYSNSFQHKTNIYFSKYDFQYLKRNDYTTTKNFEAFKKLNRIINSGIDIDFNSIINDKISLDYGIQISGNDVSHLLNSYNQDLGIDVNSNRVYSVVSSGYINYKIINKNWNSQIGLRYNYFSKVDKQTIEPRILIQNTISKVLIFQLTYERKNQQINQVRENVANDLSLENYVWVLGGSDKYPIQKASQYSAGFIYKKANWLIDLDAYYKNIDGITSFNFGIFNQNQNQTNRGNGFTKGFDVFLQKETKFIRTSFTYSYQDSQNRFENLNSFNFFPSNANIKHAVNITCLKNWNSFSMALGWFWHSGKPYSIIDSNSNTYNADNLNDYHRMDISMDYKFSTKKLNFKTGFSIYNVYNRKSLISREYERKYTSFSDFTNERFVKQDYYSLGFTPNVFLRVYF
jgi:hypothetical protein